ncbi:hypothetical protein C5748_00635 [Phyllobacterium phragmitis]|uniref:DUF937 domain-containing protein n=1 Tax=Phyllobacterium phragmitis TaxID=2670329 RepID=A0A2S9IYU2_9HYPH|nr:YidB family protein [Phyllobacterium phragmitis]PRD45703.1 hypothetical protein C5748_00635 [Phyllobacterium phragmitis]
MGLFDEASGQAVPGGSVAKPLMVALGALLVGKMLTSKSQSSAPAPAAPASTPSASAANQGAGQSAQGSQEGLSGLLDKLSNAGHSDKVSSWVGQGPNAPIHPTQLGSALGPQTVSSLAKQSGLNEPDLLSQLSKALPGIIDKLTANGQVPNQQDLAKMLHS